MFAERKMRGEGKGEGGDEVGEVGRIREGFAVCEYMRWVWALGRMFEVRKKRDEGKEEERADKKGGVYSVCVYVHGVGCRMGEGGG